MASENIEIARRAREAFNEGGVEGLLPFIDPKLEAVTPPELASEPDTYRGHDGIRRYFDSFYEAMEEIRLEPHSFDEVGGKVLVDFTLHARGKTTGIDTGLRAVAVRIFRDEKVLRGEIYPTMEEAPAAARATS